MSTWIFLRGLTREARHWGDFPSMFRAEITNANVITPDFPGNGQLNTLTSLPSVREMVEYCRTELTSRSIPPPYHLLGLSLGAMAAVEWASRYPRELLPSVLINTSMRPFSPFYHRLRPRNYLNLLRLAALENDAEKAERIVFRITSSSRELNVDVIQAWASYRDQNQVTRMNALRQLIAAVYYCAPMQRPDVPLLFLASAKDGLVNPQCSQRMADRWQSVLSAHAGAGHDLPLDDGAWLAQQVHQWLAHPAATTLPQWRPDQAAATVPINGTPLSPR